MTTPADRAFAYFQRGELRDYILTNFRLGLAVLVNPMTGAVFTADEIAQGTQQGSRWWIEADAIDLAGMAQQSRALFMADQVRVDRANSNFLRNYHGSLWGLTPLDASGGSGPITTLATPGTTYVGSTTIGDPTATTFRDAAQLRYQVLTTVVTPGSGIASLTLVAIDTGVATNLQVGAVLSLDLNPPLGGQPTASVVTTFTGGLDAETDPDYQSRIRAGIRHKAAAGNGAQFRAWAREASNAVLDGYVYSCAMHAGSVLVAVTQKRGATVGPNALVASAGTLAAATGYLVPPGSPVVPERAFIKATTFTPQPSDSVVQLSQTKGSTSGWSDVSPFPGYTSLKASINSLTNQTHFQLISDQALPSVFLSGPAPQLMVWNDATSRFEKLIVTSVIFNSIAGRYLHDVVLATPPAKTLAVGDWISPDMARRALVGLAVEQYFDGLGPGEVVNITTDSRADRASRFPDPSEEAPYRGGQAITTSINDALGATLSNISLASMSVTVPTVPTDVATGPNKLTLGKFAVYDLP